MENYDPPAETTHHTCGACKLGASVEGHLVGPLHWRIFTCNYPEVLLGWCRRGWSVCVRFPRLLLEKGANPAAGILVARREGEGQESHRSGSRVPCNLPAVFFAPLHPFSPAAVPVVIESSIWKGQDSFSLCFVGEFNWSTAIITRLFTALYTIIHLMPDQNLLENGHC